MTIEHARELGGLGLAQDRELPGSIDHRAAVLTQLDGDVAQRLHLGRISCGGQHLSQLLGGAPVRPRNLGRKAPGSMSGETSHRVCTELRIEIPQGGQGKVVVGRAAGRPPLVRQGEDTPRSATTALGCRPIGSTLLRGDVAEISQGREVTPHPGGSQPEEVGEFRHRLGPVRQQRSRHALGGLSREFHNPIVA